MSRKPLAALAALAFTLALGACSGNFASGGTAQPNGFTPPGGVGASPAVNPAASPGKTVPRPTPPPGDTVTYPISQAPSGLPCPASKGFTCELAFNLPTPSPNPSTSPSPGSSSKAATPSPSPTPTATPTPRATPSSGASGAPSASPSAAPTGPQITLHIEALTSDAPPMVKPDTKSAGTVVLVALRLTTSADTTIFGGARIAYTLPKAQIPGRGFAVQLFQEVHLKKKSVDTFIGTYDRSTLKNDRLTFSFVTPKLLVKKGETWLLVLYGDERPTKTSPSPSASPATGASPGATASPAPSTNPSPAASASP